MSKSRLFSENDKKIILDKIKSGQIDKAVDNLNNINTPVWIREITTRQDKQKKYAILGRKLGEGGFGKANEIIAFVKENPLSGKLELHEDDNYVLKQGELHTEKTSEDKEAFTKEEKLDILRHEINYGRWTGLKSKPAFVEKKSEPESNSEPDETYYDTNFAMKKGGNLSLRHFLEIKYSDVYISTMQNTIKNLKTEIDKLNADIQTQENRKISASENMREAYNTIIKRKKESIASINQRIESTNQRIKTLETNCKSALGKQIQALTPAALIHLCYAVTKALADFQKLGLAHIDIKPDNILLDLSNLDYPKARLIDTGLSTHHEKLLEGKGSLYYMAPEIMYLSSLDSVFGESSCRSQPTDQFSLGICLSNILGEFPENQRNEHGHSIIEIGKHILKNEANQNESLFNKHIQNNKSPLSSKAEAAKEILIKLTHFLPKNRYKNMSIALLEWEKMLLVDYCETKEITTQKNSIENLFNKARQLRNQLFHSSHAKKSRFSSTEKYKMEVFEKICGALNEELSHKDSDTKNKNASNTQKATDRWNDNHIEIFIRMLDIDYFKDCKTKDAIHNKIKNLQKTINENHTEIIKFRKTLNQAKVDYAAYLKKNPKKYYIAIQALEHQLADYQHKLSKCKTLDDFVELKDKGDRVLHRINAILYPNSAENSKQHENSKKNNADKPTDLQNAQTESDYAGVISKRLLSRYQKPEHHLNAQAISLQLKKLNPKEQDIYLRLEAKAARDSHWLPSESRLEVGLKYYHSVFFSPSKKAQKTAENHGKNAQEIEKPNQSTNKNQTGTGLIVSDENQGSTKPSKNQIAQLSKNDKKHILSLLTYAHAQERSWTYKIFKFFGAREADDIQHNIKVIHALVAEFLKQSLSNHNDSQNSTSSSDQPSNVNNSFKDFLINNLSLKLIKQSKDKKGRVFYEELDSELIKILTDKEGINISFNQINNSISKPARKDDTNSSTASTSSGEGSPKGKKNSGDNSKKSPAASISRSGNSIFSSAGNNQNVVGVPNKKGSSYIEVDAPKNQRNNSNGSISS